jgi:hypothetical protein
VSNKRGFDFALDFYVSPSVAIMRHATNNRRTCRIESMFRRQGPHRKRPTRAAVDQQPDVRLVTWRAQQLLGGQVAGELGRERLGVAGADLEADQRSDVAEKGGGGLFVDLDEVLVGEGQGQAVRQNSASWASGPNRNSRQRTCCWAASLPILRMGAILFLAQASP